MASDSSFPNPTLDIGPETWGDRVHRAYRIARRTWKGITYIKVAEAVSRVAPTTDTTLQRLEDLVEPPTLVQRRLTAWAYLTALGFDPADFDLPDASIAFGAATSVDVARRTLHPTSWTEPRI